jgi:predicted O-linked N-acetylglucosamine transferase (SPINDLY family)
VLRRIREGARRPLEFHVFPNVSGLELLATRRTLARELPGARVFQTMAYNRYLERLSACDLNLSPFPFGGLHSVVDSLRQGIPVVAMEGLEPHARTDAMLLRRLGMPSWLVCADAEAYVAAALRVIDDDAQRVALSRQALALDIDRVLYGDATTRLGSEVADAVWWMYRNHESIQASAQRVYKLEDRVTGKLF